MDMVRVDQDTDAVSRSSSRLDGLARFSEVAKPQPSLPATAVSEKSM